ncbi:MAG: metallophosphoesterase [Candidatus Geothermincolales bacterium]
MAGSRGKLSGGHKGGRGGRLAAPSAGIALLVVALIALLLSFPGCRSSEVPVLDPLAEDYFPKIREIVYPTFGFPQIVPAGEVFTLELDLTPGRAEGQPDEIKDLRVSIASSGSPHPFRTDLAVVDVGKGESLHWPPGAGREEEEVFLVKLEVPGNVPPDLYDLQVEAVSGGGRVSDRQLHSLSVTAGDKSEYTFVHLTDLHVYDLRVPQGNMEGRELGEARYLREAIRQVNLLRPDFVVITGDLIHGQMYLPDDWPPDARRRGVSQYDYEYMWAYRELANLDVPCFLLPGNHDGYNDGQRDGFDWWTKTYGPLYYFLDVGESRLFMLNSFDWDPQDRSLSKGPYYGMVPILEPRRWKGQFRSGGDRYDDLLVPSIEGLGGQLAWFRDRLRETPQGRLKLAFCHHDPFQEGCWSSEDYGGYRIGGGGEGRRSFLELCSLFEVRAVFSGHTHEDHLGSIPWKSGRGSTLYVNTTCTEPVDGSPDDYPGYRWVRVAGSDIGDFVYSPPHRSYPFHAQGPGVGPVDGGERRVALELEPDIAGDRWEAGAEIRGRAVNRLGRGFPALFVEFFVPAGSGVEVMVGDEAAEISRWPTSDPGVERVEARFPLGPGEDREVLVEVSR